MGEAEAPDREKPQGSWRVNVGSTATPAVPVLTYFCRERGGMEPRQSWLHLNFYYWSLGQKTGCCGRAREPSDGDDSRGSEAKPQGPFKCETLLGYRIKSRSGSTNEEVLYRSEISRDRRHGKRWMNSRYNREVD